MSMNIRVTNITFQQINSTGFSTPYRFNAKEHDPESGLFYYGARYYHPVVSKWLSVDPLASQAPGWTPYNAMWNNPILNIDPDGAWAGDYYNSSGEYLGSDGIDDDKVYTASSVTKNDQGLVTGATNSQELSMTHSEFQKSANIIMHESSGNQTESLWIAHTANNAKSVKDVGGVHSSVYGQLTAPRYSSVSSTVKSTALSVDNSTSSANYARAGLINVLTGGADPTGGAVLWDGTDFLTKGITHNKFKEAVSITMTGSHFTSYQSGVNSFMPSLSAHSSFSRSNVYLPANAPNGPVTIPGVGITFRNDYGWMGGNFYGKGKGKYYHYSTTGAQGATLFWRITPKK